MVKNSKKKGRPKKSSPKKSADERRAEIADLVNTVGPWNVSQTELAKKFNVSQQQISADLKKIKESIEITDLGDISLNMKVIYKSSLKDLSIQILQSNGKAKIEAIRAYNELSKGFTSFLESYGLKERIQQKISLEINELVDQHKQINQTFLGIAKTHSKKCYKLMMDALKNMRNN